jgi:hypothetical protein
MHGYSVHPIPNSYSTRQGLISEILASVIYHKELQVVETVSNQVLLGAPMTIDPNEVQNQLEELLKETEKGKDFKGLWNLPFKVTKEYAPGMPWETDEEKKNSRIPTSAKWVYQVVVGTNDLGRLNDLLSEIKTLKKLHVIFGPTAFTVMIPEYNQTAEQKRYQQMMQTHISVQMSIGIAPLQGIVDLYTKWGRH